MKISKKLKNTILKLMALVMVFSSLAVVPATQVDAATNKAIKFSASFDGNTISDAGRNKNTYLAEALYTKKQAKLTKSMTAQATVYIPTSLLDGINERFYLAPYVVMYDNLLQYAGTVFDKTSYIMVLHDGNSVNAYAVGSDNKYNLKTPCSYAKVTKSGKYYKVTLKIPMDSKYYKNGKSSAIKTNKKYNISVGVEIFGAATKGKGTIYVDDLKVNTKPSISINFSKKDYVANVIKGDNSKVNAKVAAVK